MADKTLRIAIDSSLAKSGAREVSASLQQVKRDAAAAMGGAKGIPVKLDASGMAEASRQVNNALRQIADKIKNEKIQLGIDGSKVEAETAGIIRRIRSEIGRNMAQGISVEASLDVVTKAAEAEIDRVLDDARQGVDIDVDADVTAALAKIDSLQDKIDARSKERQEALDILADLREDRGDSGRGSRTPRPVKIPVSADTKAADDAIDDLVDKPRDDVKVNVDADTAAFDAAVAEIKNRPKPELEWPVKAIPVGEDPATVFDEVGEAAVDASKGADKAASSIGKIEAAAKRAGASAEELGDAFRNATRDMEAMELVGEALLAIATSMVTTITAFEDYSDAVRAATGDTEAAGVAMEMLEDFATNSAFTLEDVTAAFVNFRSAGLEASRESMSSYANVAAGLNLTMEELSSAVGDAAEGNFSKLNDTQLKAVETGKTVTFTYQGVSTQVKNTAKDVAAFIKTMGNTEFAGAMEDAMGGVNGAFTAMSNAWGELVEDMGEGGLSSGLENFARSMVDASEKADELGRILGGWLGDQATLLGKDIEGLVDQLNDLVGLFRDVTDAINSIPSLSGIFDSDFMRRAVPALYAEGSTPTPEEQGPPTDPDRINRKAYGSDTNLPRKPKKAGKTDAERQAENFDRMSAGNNELLRTLKLVDESYERGRYSVEGFRNSIEETTQKIALQKSVGKENAQAILDQAMEIKAYKENIAFKGEVLDQQEAIAQTDELADAFLQGSQAVQQTEARIKAYNTAVQLGMSGSKDITDQLYKLADAAAMVQARLAMSQDIADMDEAIKQTQAMTEAVKAGGDAQRQAEIDEQTRSMALQGGYQDDPDAVQTIRYRVAALREVNEQLQVQKDLREGGFDVEQGYAEIETLELTGEAYYTANERLDMLMQKKRDTGDAAAELTADEEALAAALGKLGYQTVIANDNLSQLGRQTQTTQQQFRDMTAQGLGHFEDALVDIITGTKSAKEAFADMAKAIAADLARMAVRMAIIKPLAMMFGGGFGGGGGVSVGGGIYHTGGIVGADAVPIRPMSTWPKFHTGGLAQNETPAVLQKGEGVFTRAQMSALAPVSNQNNTSSPTVIVNVQQSQGGDSSAAENQGRIIAKHVEVAMGEYILKQQRNGGMLNPNGGY